MSQHASELPSLRSFQAQEDHKWQLDASLCPDCTCVVNAALSGWKSWDSTWKDDKFGSTKSHVWPLPVGMFQETPPTCSLCTLVSQELRGRHVLGAARYGIQAKESSVGNFIVYLGYEEAEREDILNIQLFLMDRQPEMSPTSLTHWDQVRFCLTEQGGSSSLGPQPPILYDSGSLYTPDSTVLARKWSNQCGDHDTCKAVRGNSTLPKRVLDLGSSETEVSLYVSRGESEAYAALSYCWGSAMTLKTLTSNLEDHRRGIAIETMPTTLRDTISLTRAMGLRYLWIDALCIIQDDPADWAEQSVALTDIYERCTVNIAGLDGFDCDQGLLPKVSQDSCVLASAIESAATDNDTTHVLALASPMHILKTIIQDRHLGTRGWVFQETLVSPATLRCTSGGIQWECCSKAYLADGSPAMRGGMLYPVQTQRVKEGWAEIIQRKANSPIGFNPAYIWNHYVSEFSERMLTVPTDKLPAVAGIAARFSQLFNLTYAAGLWKEHFLSGLTWGRGERGKELVKHVERAPSWSWASVDGRVAYPHIFVAGTAFPGSHIQQPELDLEVSEFRILEKHAGSFGEVERAELDVAGRLLPITISSDGDSDRQTNPDGAWTSEIGTFGRIYLDQKFVDERPASPTWALRLASFKGDMGGIKPHREGPFEFFLVVEQAREAGESFYGRTGMIMSNHSPSKYSDSRTEQTALMKEKVREAFSAVPVTKLTLI